MLHTSWSSAHPAPSMAPRLPQSRSQLEGPRSAACSSPLGPAPPAPDSSPAAHAGPRVAAMFPRCGTHPLPATEIPPTLRPSPASRKSSRLHGALNLPPPTATQPPPAGWQKVASPRPPGPLGHGKGQFCPRPPRICHSQRSAGLEPAGHVLPGRGRRGAAPGLGSRRRRLVPGLVLAS